MNKIGVCAWSLPIDGPYACKLVADLGIDGIQLDVGPYERGFPMGRKSVRKAYIEAAKEYGVEYPSMATRVSDYYSMVDEPGSDEHEIVKTGIATAISACGEMKIPRILIPNFVKSAIVSDRQFEIATEVLQWACDLAADHGIVIAAENPMPAERTRALFKAVDRKNLGLYFDTQNYFLHIDADTPSLLEQLYDLVVEVHVKDGKNKDLSGAPLGTGDASFAESAEVLKKHGYDGWIVTENYYDVPPLCGPKDEPVEIIKKDVATLRKQFG